MIYLLCYAPPSLAFATADAINDMGFLAVAPRMVVMDRNRKTDKRFVTDAPALDGYIFAAMPEPEWHRVRGSLRHDGKCLALHRLEDIDPRQWVRVQACVQRIEADYQRAMGDYERQQHDGKPRPYVCPYNVGEAIKLLGGEMQNTLARFKRLVLVNGVPVIEAEVQMFGQAVPVKVDPVKTERWAAE